MQRNGATPAQNAAPFFSSSFFSNTSTSSSNAPASSSETRESREARNKLQKDRERSRDRRPSFGRKGSFGSQGKRRASSSAGNAGDGGRPPGINVVVTDSTAPPLPDFALQLAAAAKLSRETEVLQSPASADSFSKMLSRTAPAPVNGYSQLAPPVPLTTVQSQPSESSMVHQHIQEIANKRISTLDYLRKA
jgi:hypothetical protein